MSLSRKRIFDTVKFRIALRYALLFALSSALCVLIAHLTIRRGLLNGFDRQLEAGARQFLYEYLTGQRYRQFDREIPVSAVTRGEFDAFRKKLPGVVLLLGFEKSGGDERYQTFFGVQHGKLYELRQESSGGVYSRELHPANHLEMLESSFENRARLEGVRNVWYALYGADGKLVASSPNSAELADAGELTPGFSVRGSARSDFRIMRLRLFDGATLEVGQSLKPVQQLIEEYTLLHVGIFSFFLIVGTVVGWLIARRFVNGVLRVSDAARETAGGDFSRRVPEGDGGAEINELVCTFNLMNSNTEKLFNELKMVTDNVAHDLRTPLTRMRGLAEVTVEGPPELGRYRELAGVVADECSQMIQIINTMLEITKTESNIETPEAELLDLREMIARAAELFQPLAEDGDVRLAAELPDAAVPFRGDRIKLQRVVSNLIDNALKFTPPGGTITLSLTVKEDVILFRVADTGCGIREEDLEHIFERFFRSDASRTRPGNGLGLALVRAIVRAHHGEITAASKLGEGSCFTVELPKNC